MKIKQKCCTLLAVSFLFIGCGGGSSNGPISGVTNQTTQTEPAQTVPTLRVKPQQNYTNSDGSFDKEKYQLTQTKYLNSK